jgi:hypothetical protein
MATATELPRVNKELMRAIAVSIADIKMDDWKKMTVDERRKHLGVAKRALDAERRYYRKHAAAKPGAAAKQGPAGAKAARGKKRS